ncbi:uncharacterized protein LOC123903068 [Trifolium pratense]|uniref:uncharacterized protein LOC123903068 n=1 Tax=Trifolium pratense TaxID=57577 RepID=UPI001E692D52|nr:uncharacterized protein LOC123903068 [Trifolium pratense]
MFQENRHSALFAASTSDSYIEDPPKRSRISYTRNFLLSLAKVGGLRTLKLQREIRLTMTYLFENSLGLLPSPYCEDLENSDYVCNQEKRQDSAPKAPDNVNFLHKSNEPYLPPCRNKALSSSTGDSNGSLNSNISGSSECTSQEPAEPLDSNGSLSGNKSGSSECTSQEPAESVIPDVQIQQELELKSSNMSLEDSSTCIPGLILPDEDSLITYDGPPILAPEVESPDVIDSLISAPDESNQTEDDFDWDLDSDDPTFAMIKKLAESVLDGDDDDYDDGYYDSDSSDFEYDDSLMDDIMVKLVQHGARLAHMHLSTPPSYSNQLNPGMDQQDQNCFLRSSTGPAVYSLSSHHCPYHKIYQHSPLYDPGELRRFGLGAGESTFQQGKMQPQLPAFDKLASCKEKPNPMQNWFEYKGQSYDNSVNGPPDSHGYGNIDQAAVDKFGDSHGKFFGGFYK